MKLFASNLAGHLEKTLAPIYLVSGDEPLLVSEAAQAIREAAAARGFEHRDLHVVEKGFKWAELQAGADNLSLFAARRVVELRLPTARPGDAGARVIRGLAERPDPDRLVLVVTSKLDASAARSAWVRCIEASGVAVKVLPITREDLPRWIRRRAGRRGLRLSSDAANLLADRVEGNLLAADQEMAKLALARGEGPVDAEAVMESAAMSARFDVFRLTEAVLEGQSRRAITVLAGLRAEGVEPALVSWALSRELALLARLSFALYQGEHVDQALRKHGVWRARQPQVKRALRRLSLGELTALLGRACEVDRIIKGIVTGRPWDAVTQLVVAALRPSLPEAGRPV